MGLTQKLERLDILEQGVHKHKEVSKLRFREVVQSNWGISDRIADEYFRIISLRVGIKVKDGKLISTKK